MRYVYILLIVVVTVLVLLFKIQNLTAVTVSLFGANMTMSVSWLIIAVYILGMFTGSAVVGLLRTWAKEPCRRPTEARACTRNIPVFLFFN